MEPVFLPQLYQAAVAVFLNDIFINFFNIQSHAVWKQLGRIRNFTAKIRSPICPGSCGTSIVYELYISCLWGSFFLQVNSEEWIHVWWNSLCLKFSLCFYHRAALLHLFSMPSADLWAEAEWGCQRVSAGVLMCGEQKVVPSVNLWKRK